MLLVDRILEVSPDGIRGRGLKNVSMNEPFFQGHYPGKPIMPGVLIVEAMAQCGAAILLMREEFKNTIPLMAAVDDVKFKRMVIPGDQLIIDCEILWVRRSIGRMKSIATVEGEMATSMEMTFKLMERER